MLLIQESCSWLEAVAFHTSLVCCMTSCRSTPLAEVTCALSRSCGLSQIPVGGNCGSSGPRRANDGRPRLTLHAPSGARPTHASARVSACRALAPLLRALDPHVGSRAARAAHDAAAGHAPSCGPPRHPRHAAERVRRPARRVFVDEVLQMQLIESERHRHGLVRADHAHRRRCASSQPCELGGLDRHGRRRERRRVR
jgi:hypothetical protein